MITGIVFNDISPAWLLLEGIYFAVAAGLLVLAFKAKTGWAKASFGAFGLAILAWHTLAILPSWWMYYADGVLGWGGQGCTSLASGDEIISCLKQSARDIVVVGENGVALGAFVLGFLIYQKKFPKQLAAGESKPEATGGYR